MHKMYGLVLFFTYVQCMIITQHLHIYGTLTSNFIFSDKKIISSPPTNTYVLWWVIRGIKIPSLKLSSPDLYVCSSVAFRTMLWLSGRQNHFCIPSPKLVPRVDSIILKKDEPNNQNHSNQVTIPGTPDGGIRRIHPKPLQTMASDVNSPWAHLIQGTAGMANLTPPTPLPSSIQVTLPNYQFFAHKIIAKWRKRPNPCKPPPSSSQSHISILEVITAPQPQPNDTQQSLTTRPLPHFTPIFVEIAQEVMKIHPIKCKPSPTPPKIHLDHTLPFQKQSRWRCHPPTTPNDPSPSGYCQHSNSCGNSMRTCEDTPNQMQGPTYTFQNHTTIFLEDESLKNCHNTTSSHSHHEPSLTTRSPCPTPPHNHHTPDI